MLDVGVLPGLGNHSVVPEDIEGIVPKLALQTTLEISFTSVQSRAKSDDFPNERRFRAASVQFATEDVFGLLFSLTTTKDWFTSDADIVA